MKDSVAARALELAILTAARTEEITGMRWGEVDFENRVWTVPGTRMKAGREHRVPLSSPAIALLEPDSKDNYRASRLTAIWMQANVTKAARVPARFS